MQVTITKTICDVCNKNEITNEEGDDGLNYGQTNPPNLLPEKIERNGHTYQLRLSIASYTDAKNIDVCSECRDAILEQLAAQMELNLTPPEARKG